MPTPRLLGVSKRWCCFGSHTLPSRTVALITQSYPAEQVALLTQSYPADLEATLLQLGLATSTSSFSAAGALDGEELLPIELLVSRHRKLHMKLASRKANVRAMPRAVSGRGRLRSCRPENVECPNKIVSQTACTTQQKHRRNRELCMDRLARHNRDIKGTVSSAWDLELFALTRLTAWHARPGIPQLFTRRAHNRRRTKSASNVQLQSLGCSREAHRTHGSTCTA